MELLKNDPSTSLETAVTKIREAHDQQLIAMELRFDEKLREKDETIAELRKSIEVNIAIQILLIIN